MVVYNENVTINSPYSLSVGGGITANNNIDSKEYWQHLGYDDFISAIYNHTFTDTTGKITFSDLNAGNNYVTLHGELLGTSSTGDPALVCSQHLVVEKDFIAKGFLNSLEGEVALNAGSFSPGWGPYTSNPFIWLKDTNYSTLEIRKVVTAGQGDADKRNPINYIWGWGNLALGSLIANDMIKLKFTHLVSGPEHIVFNKYDATGAFWWRKTSTLYGNTPYTELMSLDNSCNLTLTNGNILPASANVGNIGTNTQYWGSMWTNYLRYKDIRSFDALDDLALAKSYRIKSISEEGIEREVVDPESLSFLKAESEEPFFDNGKTTGFLLGCVKALVHRVEALEKQTKQKQTAS